jgi:hypothetical protein
VDVWGREKWLIELVTMKHLGDWTNVIDDNGTAGSVFSWFEEPRPADKHWPSIEVPSKALGHLVLVRLAAEVIGAYGRPVPDHIVAPRAREENADAA